MRWMRHFYGYNTNLQVDIIGWQMSSPWIQYNFTGQNYEMACYLYGDSILYWPTLWGDWDSIFIYVDSRTQKYFSAKNKPGKFKSKKNESLNNECVLWCIFFLIFRYKRRWCGLPPCRKILVKSWTWLLLDMWWCLLFMNFEPWVLWLLHCSESWVVVLLFI